MSRTTVSINRIITALDSISGLDGIVADLLQAKADDIEATVELILRDREGDE